MSAERNVDTRRAGVSKRDALQLDESQTTVKVAVPRPNLLGDFEQPNRRKNTSLHADDFRRYHSGGDFSGGIGGLCYALAWFGASAHGPMARLATGARVCDCSSENAQNRTSLDWIATEAVKRVTQTRLRGLREGRHIAGCVEAMYCVWSKMGQGDELSTCRAQACSPWHPAVETRAGVA